MRGPVQGVETLVTSEHILTSSGPVATMKSMKTNDFERKLESVPSDWKGPIVDVVDTLDLAWRKASELFGTDAKPEHAISIMHAILARKARVEDGFGS